MLSSTSAQQIQENDGYTIIMINILLFYTINEMPIVHDLARLDDNVGETQRKYEAHYHQSCRLMFNNTDNYAY